MDSLQKRSLFVQNCLIMVLSEAWAGVGTRYAQVLRLRARVPGLRAKGLKFL